MIAPGHPQFVVAAVGTAYVLAGAGVAVAGGTSQVEHGSWLVAYLALVGGIAQTLLGLGALRLERSATPTMPPATRRGLVLWNLGVPLVPIGVLSATPVWVGVGGVLELFALCVLGTAAIATAARARPAVEFPLVVAYLVLVVGLALSVVIGMRLGDALPH